MVPVTINRVILSEALKALATHADRLNEGEALQIAFHAYLLRAKESTSKLESLADSLETEISGGGRSIQSVAALGFILTNLPSLTEAHKRSFEQGVEWLLGRESGSQGGRAALLQPIAQLGVMVGLLTTQNKGLFTRFSEWTESLIRLVNATSAPHSSWRDDLLRLVAERFRAGLENVIPVSIKDASSATFVAMGLASSDDVEFGSFSSSLLERIKLLQYSEPEEALLDLIAYKYLAKSELAVDLRNPSVTDVSTILDRLPAALRRWTWEDEKKTRNSTPQKWAIEHEYHFQNLLYTVLLPVFQEIKDEEWLASVGQKKPRADLVLPSLRLVLEVKYWRTNQNPQEIISQVAEDASLYLKKDSPYLHLLPIIWDQGRRTEEHHLLKSGLSDLNGVITPVVIAQPASMG